MEYNYTSIMMKGSIIARIIILSTMLLSAQVGLSQTINGPDRICAGGTFTYSVIGLRDEIMWSVEGGTILGDTDVAGITVRWSSQPGQVTVSGIKDKWGNIGFAAMAVRAMAGGKTSIGASGSLAAGESADTFKTSPSEDIAADAVSDLPVTYACGSYSGMVTLSNYLGGVIRWEQSYDQVNWQNIGNASFNTLQIHVVQTTHFRAVVGNAYCYLYSALSTVFIKQAPVAIASSDSHCGPGDLTLGVSFPEAEEFRWYTQPEGGQPFNRTSSYKITNAVSDVKYWVSAVRTCEGPRVQVNGTILPLPPYPHVTFNDPIYECGKTTVTVPMAAPEGYAYYWQTGPGNIAVDMPVTLPLVLHGNSTGFAYFNMRNNSTGCFGPPDSRYVGVYKTAPQPLVPKIESEECFSVVLNGLSPTVPGTAYYWQTDPNGTSRAHPEQFFTATQGGTYHLRSTFVNSECWSPAASISVTVKRTKCIEEQVQNYVITHTVQQEGVKSAAALPYLEKENNAVLVSYADGFGRLVQEVSFQAAPSGRDHVKVKAYDAYGRESKRYIPYSGPENTGKFRADALNEQLEFYSEASAAAHAHAATTTPWAISVFEASSLNRVKEQGAPGESWQPGNSTVKTKVIANLEGKVRHWNFNPVTGTCSSPDAYGAGQLLGEEVTDEHGFKTWTFKNMQGKMVLLQKEVNATDRISTYYVYDSFGRLRMIIQPEGFRQLQLSGSWSVDPSFAAKWCFAYDYDAQGRKISQRTPGAETVWLVYNKRNQVILTQDGNQRQHKRWTFTKYDDLKRVIMTGIYTHRSQASREQVQQAADSIERQAEVRTPANFTSQHGYTINQAFPVLTANNSAIHLVNYYDQYNFDADQTTGDPVYIPSGISPEPVPAPDNINRITGTRVAIPATGQMLLTVKFYDKRGNIIQRQEDNHLGGKDVFSFQYDFTRHVTADMRHHTSPTANVKVARFYQYDHVGKLLTVKQKVNTSPLVMVAAYKYNELGKLVEKKLHSTDATNYLQNVDMRYTVRGWLSSINDKTLSEPSDLFGMELIYQEPVSFANVPRQYNGNITEMIYNDRVLSNQRGYGFRYDRLNRLTAATYTARNSAGVLEQGAYNEDGISYDFNGNITNLARYSHAKTHEFTYSYTGNQLVGLFNAAGNAIPAQPEESLTTPPDQTEFPNHGLADMNATDAFRYDANGNLTADKTQGIISVVYNHLNLAETIDLENRGRIEYRYNAQGAKLSKTVIDSTGAQTKREYVAGFEYDASRQLQFFSTDEGRIILTSTEPEYQYYLKDHLGNVRITFTSKPQTITSTATFETVSIREEQNQFHGLLDAAKLNYKLFDHTRRGETSYAARLNGTGRERFGLARSVSVMTGDVIKMEVYAKYVDTDRNNWTAALTNFLTTVAAGTTSAQMGVDGGAAESAGRTSPPWGQWLDKSNDQGSEPKAYLNYVVFDRTFNYKDGGYVRVSALAKENGRDVAHERLAHELTINEPGYVYIYLSNENEVPVDVYFDDFSVTQVQSLVLKSDDYYPFGMAFNSFARENTMGQYYMLNGKERQTELALNWDDFGARMYNAEIGRWNGVDPLAEKYQMLSPFSYVANNPVRNIDTDGKEIWIYIDTMEKNLQNNTAGKVQYRDGKLFDEKGKPYKGDNKFVTAVKKDLDALAKNDMFKERMNVLSKSPLEHTIQRGLADNGTNYQSTDNKNHHIATGAIVTYNHQMETLLGEPHKPREGLAHELLSHGYDADQGIANYEKMWGGFEANEVDGVNIQNIVREEVGLPPKRTYGGEDGFYIPEYLLWVKPIKPPLK